MRHGSIKYSIFTFPVLKKKSGDNCLYLAFLEGQLSISLLAPPILSALSFLPISLKGKSAPESIQATKMTETISVPCKCHRRPEHTGEDD